MAEFKRAIGIRELKAHTSAVLREVQETGAEFVITMHGRPVARIEPVEGERAMPVVNGMGDSRGVLSGLPSLSWQDFEAGKQLWEPGPLDDK